MLLKRTVCALKRVAEARDTFFVLTFAGMMQLYNLFLCEREREGERELVQP